MSWRVANDSVADLGDLIEAGRAAGEVTVAPDDDSKGGPHHCTYHQTGKDTVGADSQVNKSVQGVNATWQGRILQTRESNLQPINNPRMAESLSAALLKGINLPLTPAFWNMPSCRAM